MQKFSHDFLDFFFSKTVHEKKNVYENQNDYRNNVNLRLIFHLVFLYVNFLMLRIIKQGAHFQWC